MRWLVPAVNSEAAGHLARELGISLLLARALVLRGIEEPEAAYRFLHPSLDHLHDPYLMADMDIAVQRLRQAIERQEKILIYGDYDVDGTMAVVVLLTALRSLGARVETYVPHRLTEGYGMRAPVIERMAAEGYTLVVSVDTGTREHEVIARARELGVDCIVTDHHLPKTSLPPARALLNPRRPDCAYPEKNLSGVGVAFKLVQALLGPRLSPRLLQSYLKIVAIGTIADVVPLMGENRVIARFGVAGLGHPAHVGLGALLSVAGLEGRRITTGDVAYRLAPRLNASGRMESARDVIDLFTTSDAHKACESAERLERLNRDRQSVEEQILGEITDILDRQPERAERYCLVFSGEGWHRGVIGIVAQRIVDRYHRPAVIIGIDNGMGQGSGRSIARFHLLDALGSAADLFERFGGHAQAAGFTLPSQRVAELETRLESYARTVLAPEDLEAVLRVDAELSLTEISGALYEELQGLEPSGFGNPAPVFMARGLRLLTPPRVLKDKHLKVTVGQGTNSIEALGWGRAHLFPALSPGQIIDLAFTLGEDRYQGSSKLQLVIKDLRLNGQPD